MNIMKTIKQIIGSACTYFTAAQFFLLLIATGYSEIAPEDGGTTALYLSLGSAALIFLACLIMAALNLVWRLDYSISLRMLIHFLGSLAAFAVVFIIIPGVYDSIAQILVRSLVFTAIYMIIAFIVLITNSIRNNRRTEDFEYESQFGEFRRKH